MSRTTRAPTAPPRRRPTMGKLYALLAAPAAALVAKTNPLPRAAPRAAPADVEMKYRVAVIGGGPSGAAAQGGGPGHGGGGGGDATHGEGGVRAATP